MNKWLACSCDSAKDKGVRSQIVGHLGLKHWGWKEMITIFLREISPLTLLNNVYALFHRLFLFFDPRFCVRSFCGFDGFSRWLSSPGGRPYVMRKTYSGRQHLFARNNRPCSSISYQLRWNHSIKLRIWPRPIKTCILLRMAYKVDNFLKITRALGTKRSTNCE